MKRAPKIYCDCFSSNQAWNRFIIFLVIEGHLAKVVHVHGVFFGPHDAPCLGLLFQSLWPKVTQSAMLHWQICSCLLSTQLREEALHRDVEGHLWSASINKGSKAENHPLPHAYITRYSSFNPLVMPHVVSDDVKEDLECTVQNWTYG